MGNMVEKIRICNYGKIKYSNVQHWRYAHKITIFVWLRIINLSLCFYSFTEYICLTYGACPGMFHNIGNRYYSHWFSILHNWNSPVTLLSDNPRSLFYRLIEYIDFGARRKAG